MRPSICASVLLLLGMLPSSALGQPRGDAGADAPRPDVITTAVVDAPGPSSRGRPLTAEEFRGCFAASPIVAARSTAPPSATSTPEAPMSMAAACATLRANPASVAYVPAAPAGSVVISGAAGGAASAAPPGLEATVLVGVADFFVARARAEAHLFLQERLGGAVCPAETSGDDGGGPAGAAQRALLPDTCDTFRPDGGDFADPAQLVSLPAAFRRDLDALPRSLPAFLSAQLRTVPAAPAHGAAGLTADERKGVQLTLCVAAMFGVASPHFGHGPPELAFTALADLLSSPATDAAGAPAQALHAACDPALAAHAAEVAEAFRALAAAVGSLASASHDGSLDVIDALRAHYVAAMQLDASSGPASTLPQTLAWLDAHRGELTRLGAAIAELRRQGSNDERAAELLGAAARVLGAITEHPGVVAALPGDTAVRTALQHDLPAVVEAAGDIVKKQYLAGALALLHLRAIDLVLAHLPDGAGRRMIVNLRRFGALVGAIAQARTSDEVTAALDAAAAPVGSYRQMRRPGITVALAGQLGVLVGGETAFGDVGPGNPNTRGALGATLPIGLEVGGGIGCGWSFQALFSVIDLGTLATGVYGGSDASATTPAPGPRGTAAAATPDIGAVFAPGVFLGFGIPHTPLVVGPMIELAPLMRRYIACTTSTCETTSLPTLRYGLVLTLDVPVLQIF